MVTRSSLRIFCLSTETTCRGTLLSLEKFPDRKISIKRGEGMPFTFSRRNSHTTGTIRKGTFPCFRKFLVTEKLMDKRREWHDFLSMFFFSQDRNFLLGNPSLFRKNQISKKIMFERGGGACHNFPSKFFSNCRKTFVEEHFCVSEKFRYWKLLWRREGKSMIFCPFFFSGYRTFS